MTIPGLVDDVVGAFTAGGNILDAGAVKAIAEAKNAKTPEQALEILGSAGVVQSVGQAAEAGASAASNPESILGLPELSNLRNLVIRSAKVIVGMLLIAIGAVKLLHVEQAVKTVAPVGAVL